MSNFDILKPILKGAAPMLANMPVEKQSETVVDVERWLARWFEQKQLNTVLDENEAELVMMLRLVDGELLMIPCTIADNEGSDYVARALVDQGVNVTRMAAKIPAYQLLPILLGEDTRTPVGKLRMQQAFIGMLRTAAHHPDARIDVEEAEEGTHIGTEGPQVPATEIISVDALGETSVDIENDNVWNAIPVQNDEGADLYEIKPQDEWSALPIAEQNEVLASLDITRDQLITEQQ